MKKVIIDCDPGVDDTLALVLALTKSNLDVQAITTVCGNVSGEKTTRNAQLLLNALDSDIPLGKGSMIPLVKKHVAADVHGQDGLGNKSHTLPQESYKHFSDTGAVQLIAEILEASEEPITIIAVGPLTNIALLLHTYPHLKTKIHEISIMGGGIEMGNVTEHAEFNIYVDPEACHMVLNSGVPMVWATLNATHQASLLMEDMEKFSFISTPLTQLIGDIMWRYAEHDSALHDPVSVLWVTNPELFETESLNLQVDYTDDETRGKTYVVEDASPNVRVITKVNREQVIQEIADSFKKIN